MSADRPLRDRLPPAERFSTITPVWADGGYTGRLAAWAAAMLALTVTAGS
jgi:hypothetical protein